MVKIVTDSASDLPIEFQERYNITVVPSRIWFGSESYLDGVDISTSQFLSILQKNPLIPRTTHAKPSMFMKAFESDNEPVLAILTSSKLSPFYSSAEYAVFQAGLTHVTLFDSMNVSAALSTFVIFAAEMVQKGYSIREIVRVLDDLRKRTRSFIMFDTLKYVVRGGRTSSTQGLIVSALNLKPILSIDEGLLESHTVAFGYSKGMDKLIDLTRNEFHPNEPLYCNVVYAGNPLDAQQLTSKVKDQLRCKTLRTSSIGPSVASNTGPGALGVMTVPYPNF